MNFLIEEVFLGINPATRHGDMDVHLPVLKSSDPVPPSRVVVGRHIYLSSTLWRDHYLKTPSVSWQREKEFWNWILEWDLEEIFPKICNFYLQTVLITPNMKYMCNHSTSKSMNCLFMASATQFTFYSFLWLTSVNLIVFKCHYDLLKPCEF